MITQGKDYIVSVSAVNSVGTSDKSEVTLRYGEVPDNAIPLIAPDDEITTDNDYLDIKWATELYSNFVLDVYNEDGQLMLSEIITDTDNVTINNVDPGKYYVYLTALRKGTEDVFKAQDMMTVNVTLPEPVVTEYILDDGEKFYPMYEDTQMGLLYFYDEEIVDIDEVASNGKIIKTKKKKITEKQVKSVGFYRNLAMQQTRVEYFEGSAELTIKADNSINYSYNGSTMSIYDDSMGNAVVEEAK